MPALEYVNIRPEWADTLEELELMCFPTTDPEDLYDADSLRDFCAVFPEGGFVALDEGRPVAMGLGIRVHFDFDHYQHSIGDVVGHHGHEGHRADGEWYYGTTITVHPDYRRRGIGQHLYDLRKGVVRRLNMRGIVAGGVIPGYADHKHEMSAEDYVARVQAGELYDPTLSFQIENGFEARGAIADYIRDEAVGSWASLIVWENPDFVPDGGPDEAPSEVHA
jgi:GNAT superfamily N-acetyltransferase